jgi:hypothetical protein
VTYRTVSRNNVTATNATEGGQQGVNGQTLLEGTTHTLRAETITANGGNHIVDAMFAFDERARFGITTPQPSAFNGDVFEFPELYPESVSASLPESETRRKLTESELIQTWNNTDNNASVTINIGNQSKTVDNPPRNSSGQVRETISVSNSDAARNTSAEITLSRFQDSTDTTIPNDGDGAQEVTFHSLNGNPSAINRSGIGEVTVRTSFGSQQLGSTLIRESGQKAGGDLLTRSIFADVFIKDDNIVPVEKLRFIPE